MQERGMTVYRMEVIENVQKQYEQFDDYIYSPIWTIDLEWKYEIEMDEIN